MKQKMQSKKEAILNAAISVFAKRGYHLCRTLDISNEAGVAYGSLYSYFKSKDDILLSIYRERWNNLLAMMDRVDREIDDPGEKIEKIFRFIFKSLQNYPDMMKVLIMEVPRLEQFYTPENQKLYNRFFVGIADIIREGQKKGVFDRSIPPVIGSFTVAGAVDAVIRQYVYNPDFKKARHPIDEVMEQTIKILKKGIEERQAQEAKGKGQKAKGIKNKPNA